MQCVCCVCVCACGLRSAQDSLPELLLSWFFLLSATLVNFWPFFRSEVIHAGRRDDRICCNATHTTLPPTTLTSCSEGLRGGRAFCHCPICSAHPEATLEDRVLLPPLGGSPCSTTAISPCLSYSDATLYTTNPCSGLTMASQVYTICSAVMVWSRASCLR